MPKFVKSSLVDQIFDYLQSEILKGTWAPGETAPIRNGTGRVFRCQSYVPAQCHPALLCHGINRNPCR